MGSGVVVVTQRFGRYGTWLACCLSRGREAPLRNSDIDLLAGELGERSSAGGLEAQIASVLLREADDQGEVRMTQSQLADLLGAQRSSVQRVLKSLAGAGLIELHYRRIELVDRRGVVSLLDADAPEPLAPETPNR